MRSHSFDEFFASNQKDTVSPFVTPKSRKWIRNLSMIRALLAGSLLAVAFVVSLYATPLSFFILTSVYLLVGTPALIETLRNLSRFEINIDVLMTLAGLLSVLIGSQFEGALLLVLFELSATMEQMVERKTRSSLLALHKLSPHTAALITSDGQVVERTVEEIEVGSFILIKSGEMIPLDGIVTEGQSDVNLVHLTGESRPFTKTVGDEVAAGSTNLDGTLTLRVTKNSGDSTLSRIVQLITKAQESKPHVEKLLNRFEKYYATIVISLSCGFAIGFPLLSSQPLLGTEGSIYRALSFLIAASPCALILATPTAYLSAISSCVRRGIVPKGGVTLDGVARCRIVAFDKTGTLTTGNLSCIGVEQIGGPALPIERALEIASSLERHAVHPIAQAIVHHAQERGIRFLPVIDFKSIPGYGLEGVVDGCPCAIGHLSFIEKKTTHPLPPSPEMTTYLAIEDVLFAFYFTDTVRTGAKETVAQLQSHSLRVVMLTGDQELNAQSVAQSLCLEEYCSNLRPEDKLAKVEELSQHADVMMVGDGINDAPALARATVGISMGKIGSATAVEASDIIFIHDDISLLDWLYRKACQTRRVLQQNITLALGVILCATTPALMGTIPLWVAVLLHEGGTLLVALNSLRLLRK